MMTGTGKSLMILLLMPLSLVAQDDYETFVKESDQAFEEFQRLTSAEYHQFIKQTDEEWADYLRQAWEEFELMEGLPRPQKPKPVDFPAVEPGIVPTSQKLNLDPPPPALTPVPLVMPTNHNQQVFRGLPSQAGYRFFGQTVSIRYDPMLKQASIGETISPQAIANFWASISSIQYQAMLNDLWYYQEKFALNDFGFYLLTKAFAGTLSPNQNDQRLITWFVMTKAKYRVKVGYAAQSVYLMLPSQQTIYGVSFLAFNDLRYYVFGHEEGEIYSYERDYKNANKLLDLRQTKALNLGADIGSRKISFDFNGQSYDFEFNYQEAAIAFYAAFPQASLDVYFNSVPSAVTKESFLLNLQPVLAGMKEEEALAFLLKFVQVAFPYRVDEQQFGKEKVFFPEEMLHYPYSDCEDRSILFAYLVTTLMGNQVIALDYPEHVATAVNTVTDIAGDYFIFEGQKYVVCDPTYINAPVGVTLDHLASLEPKPVGIMTSEKAPLLSQQSSSGFRELGDLSRSAFASTGAGQLAYGSYQESIDGGAFRLESRNNSRGIYLSYLNNQNQVQWMKDIGDDLDNYILESIKDGDQNLYLLMESRGSTDFQIKRSVIKLDPTGNQLWIADLPVTKARFNEASIEATLISHEGKILAREFFGDMLNGNQEKLSLNMQFLLVTLPVEDLDSSGVNSQFNQAMDSEIDRVERAGYEPGTAPLVAFFYLARHHGFSTSGPELQQAFASRSDISQALTGFTSITSSSGVVTFGTDGSAVSLGDLRVTDGAQVKVLEQSSGQLLINVISGITVKRASLDFPVNHLKLFRGSGQVLVDYDHDHAQLSLYPGKSTTKN